MEVGNSNLTVVDNIRRTKLNKSLSSLHFNAISNKNKFRSKSLQNMEEHEALLQNGMAPFVVPKFGDRENNYRNLDSDIPQRKKADNEQDTARNAQRFNRGDPNEIGIPVNTPARSYNEGKTNHKFNQADDISILPFILHEPLQNSEAKSSNARPESIKQRFPLEHRTIRTSRNAADELAYAPVLPATPPLGLSRMNSRSLRGRGFDSPSISGALPYFGRPDSDVGSQVSRTFSDAASFRSLASIGMGSTDGKKMIIRKVPTSPGELFNIVNPPTPPEEFLYEDNNSADGSYSEDGYRGFKKPRRQHWSNKLQFVLACVGYSVGLGSVWRFPYLCYKSGGGVFLIPYFIIMLICGVPLLYMELSVGQFTGRGPIGALGQFCPLFKGVGVASVVISFLMSTYYCVIIAYGIYYFFTSFKSNHPWEECSNRWNTDKCWVPSRLEHNISRPVDSETPAEQFFDLKVLKISKGIEWPGMLRWDLVACLLCAWVLVYFAIWKSIRSSAKVRYFTATLSFLLIIVFLGKALTLEGAQKGMLFFFKPKWELLGNHQVWVNAAAQTFNSMGIAFGSMISFASYNKFNNNILHDTLAVSYVNLVTSMLVGILTFATIGNIAFEQNTSVEDVLTDGPGLTFVLYPQAIAKMPVSKLWAALFFFMMLCLGLNSMFAIVEVVVTSIQDGFPAWVKKRLLCHEMLVFLICIVSFICGLPNVTQGGIYFFQLMDHYAASISIMYLAFFEVIAVAWIYGIKRLSKDIESMTGKTPSIYFKFSWLIAAPALIVSLWIFCLIDYRSPTYNNGKYHYPVWAVVLGWIISSLSILCIPIFAIYIFTNHKGNTFMEKLRSTIKPNFYECEKCGEATCEHVEEINQYESRPMMILATGDSKSGTNMIPLTSSYVPFGNPPVLHRTATNSPVVSRHTYNRHAGSSPVIQSLDSDGAFGNCNAETLKSNSTKIG